MATLYQDQPQTVSDSTGLGLVAGLVLVLAVIALVFLATRAAPGAFDTTTNNEINLPATGGAIEEGSATNDVPTPTE